MRTFMVLLVVIIILGGGWYWYSMQTPTDTNTDVTPSQNTDTAVNTDTSAASGGTTVNIDGSVTIGATKEFTVTNSGMTFATKAISIKKGDKVKITFTNTGGTHDFRIDGYNVGTKVLTVGQSETFEFTADKAGSFEYFCSVGNHRASGMVGTLTVTP